MKRLIKIIFLMLYLVSFLNAGENFSEMSTQELIAIMGYVKPMEKTKFEKELKSRIPAMSSSEKAKYEKNINKIK